MYGEWLVIMVVWVATISTRDMHVSDMEFKCLIKDAKFDNNDGSFRLA